MACANTLDDIIGRYTIQPNDCWEWEDSCDGNGYGHMRFQGRQHQVHRLSWMRNKGPIPDGLYVLHRCDNRKCLNPDHLFLGTYKDNAIDREQKHRGADRTGASNGRALLIDTDVRSIKQELADGKTCAELATKYKVTWATIKFIKAGVTWRHIQ